jgi:hypothetical protein
MNLILFVFLFVGMVFVMIGFIKSQKNCPPPRIEYRFVPRSFVEEQESPVPVTDIFASMFYDSSSFINHESSKLIPPPNMQQHQMNKFFISQN